MFKQEKWALIASVTLLMGMLAGCGAANGGNSVNQGINAEQTGPGVGNPGSGGEVSDGMQENQAADFIGKVVSVTAESIVLQKSTMQPADMSGGGQNFGRGMRRGASNDASDERPQPPADDSQEGQKRPSERGTGGRGFSGEMDFSDEQITVRIGEGTELLTTSFGDGGMTTVPLQLSDIQDGDILTVWLADDDTTNEQTNAQTDEPTAEKIMKRQMPTNREGAGGRQ